MRMTWSALFVLGACSGASVKFQMSNDTAVARTSDGAAATDGVVLKLKLIAAYLAEDVDPVTMNNVGATEMIWLNPQCQDDISGCNVSGFAEPACGPRVTGGGGRARAGAGGGAGRGARGATGAPGAGR